MIKIEELVIEAKNGDKEAFSKLILEMQNELKRIAKSRINNNEDINDVMQNTIIKAYLNIKKVENIEYFKTWIIKILINECNNFYLNKKKDDKLVEKYLSKYEDIEYMEDQLDFDFDNIIKILNETEQEIFRLFYQYDYTTKQISKKLHIKENTIRAILSKGRKKIKKRQPTTILLFILFVAIAGSVFAATIINVLKNYFGIQNIGAENDGVLMAIENIEWYQEVNMDYIDLGDGYKIKAEYCLMDEMNLYIIFNLESEEKIDNFLDVSLADLKIMNQSGELICDNDNIFSQQYAIQTGDKVIEREKNSIKFLVYMYTNSFPMSTDLNISFSRIILSKKSVLTSNKYLELTANTNFNINLSEKFINRDYTSYKTENNGIEKAIITETGFYAIIETEKADKLKAKIIDENGAIFDCYTATLTDYNFKYIIIANFNDITTNKLSLIINDTKYELIKED